MQEIEPVCWNCGRVGKIRNNKNEVVFYEPCALYRHRMICRYIPEIKPICRNCQNYDEDVGCLDGFSQDNPNCRFRPKDKFRQKTLSTDDNLRKDMCYVCPFRGIPVDDIIEKCKGCPINWVEYGIEF